MTASGGHTGSNDACAEFVHSTVSVIPSLLERLIFLASIRETDTAAYNDRAIEALLALKFGKAETRAVQRDEQVIGLPCRKTELDYALQREHLAVFEEWLCLDTRQRMWELESYAASQNIPPSALFRKWTDEKPYKGLIPPGAMPVQQQLFLGVRPRNLVRCGVNASASIGSAVS